MFAAIKNENGLYRRLTITKKKNYNKSRTTTLQKKNQFNST